MRTFTPIRNGILTNRELELFHAPSLPEWGYTEEQTDTFAVMHPAAACKAEQYPLCVVFHSAGHDLFSTLGTVWDPGNHDIYHTPKEMFALYVDCRQHEAKDWWWGGNSAIEILGEDRCGVTPQPVEHRIMATVKWVMENYPIDKNRVYALGNSMGGSGALGIAMCRGDIFAAVKANVPAGVRHIAARCDFDGTAPEGFHIPDPPVLVDYSAQNDKWSGGHQVLYAGMKKKKYALLGYWGMFGHANEDAYINSINDLVHSFDVFSVRLNEAYPVFTNASTDDAIPWGKDGSILHEESGQVNSFFRWGKVEETATSAAVSLRLLTADEWESRVTFPTESTADVTLRRLQKCHFAAGAAVAWTFGTQSGRVVADADGLVTVPNVKVTTDATVLKLQVK